MLLVPIILDTQVPQVHLETRALLALRDWEEIQEQMESREHEDAKDPEVHKDHQDHQVQGSVTAMPNGTTNTFSWLYTFCGGAGISWRTRVRWCSW